MPSSNESSLKTLVLGASTKPGRFSYLAIKSLIKNGVDVVAIGAREGELDGIKIHNKQTPIDELHTVSLYLSPANQANYLDYIIKLKPHRIVFNPGTENPTLVKMARENNIEVVFDCTLVMLNNGSFFK